MAGTAQQLRVSAHPRSLTPVTLRAILIAAVLIPVVIYPVTQAELYWHSAQPSSFAIFANTIMALFFVGLGSRFLRRLHPHWALSRGELLAIFTLLCVAQGLAGHDMGQSLMGVHTHAQWYATPQNKWMELFGQYIPKELVIEDPGALKRWYGGDASLLASGDIRFWMRPFSFWFVAAMGMLWVSLCVVSLLRRRWVEEERLSFPLAQGPLIMTDEGGSLYRNRAFWWAFAVVSLWNTLRVIHQFYPPFPAIATSYTIWLGGASLPWSAMTTVHFWFRSSVVATAFYMPLDLSFSCWFFWLAVNVQLLFIASLGYKTPYRYNQQSVAVWIALVAVSLWRVWPTLTTCFSSALAGRHDPRESSEALPYRTAFLGLLVGVAFLTWFAVYHGMTLAVAVFWWVMYFVLVLAATRIRVELGAPATELSGAGPDWMLVTALGSSAVGGGNLTVMRYFGWFIGSHRCHPQQHAMEGLKLAQEGGVHPRRLTYAMLGAGALGFAYLYWMVVNMYYRIGAEHDPHSGYVTYPGLAYHAPDTMGLAKLLQSPLGTNWPDLGHFAGGLLFTILLYALRQRFTGFPLHPIGYALGWSWTMFINWMSVFLGWLLKAAILRYGGFRLYQQALPVVTGFLVGDFVSGFGWNIIAQFFHVPLKGFP